jgi:hypothetical protein
MREAAPAAQMDHRDLLRSTNAYGVGAGSAVTSGTATEVSSSVGAVVDVVVSPSVISGFGGLGGSSWAELTPAATPNAPMASNALAPNVAAPSFSCFDLTLTTPFRSSGATSRLIEQFAKGSTMTPTHEG